MKYADLLPSLNGVASRLYQHQTVDEAIDRLSSTFSSVMLELPTGSGKTITGLSTAAILCDTFGYKNVGWCAMRRDLLHQAEEECRRRGFKINFIPISMFQKEAPEVDILVIDEAHHDATASMAYIHKITKPKKTIGLTATPYRSDGAELMFEDFIAKSGIYELIRQGYIAKPEHYTIHEWSTDTVAQVYIKNRELFGKTVMYFSTLVDCRDTCAQLKAAGVKAEVIFASSDREGQLGAFREGTIEVLLNVGILTEGFDCPDLETVFVRPTDSPVLATQMCGRVLRIHEGKVKKIVQCSETRHPFTKIAEVKDQFLWLQEAQDWKQISPDYSKILEIINRGDFMVKSQHTSIRDKHEVLAIKAASRK